MHGYACAVQLATVYSYDIFSYDHCYDIASLHAYPSILQAILAMYITIAIKLCSYS